MDEAVAIVVPVSVCVVLPIALVWIVYRSITNKTNRECEVIMEAIRNNPNIDTEKLLEAFKRKEPSAWQYLNRKLLRGSIFTLLGITFALVASLEAGPQEEMGCWVACGVLGSVGIGFLLSYLFGYKHINEIIADQKKK